MILRGKFQMTNQIAVGGKKEGTSFGCSGETYR